MTTNDLLKKARVIRRMVGEIDAYYHRFRQPMPLRIVSAKYSRALSNLGGFHETMKELESDGSVVLNYEISGRTLVYPESAHKLVLLPGAAL